MLTTFVCSTHLYVYVTSIDFLGFLRFVGASCHSFFKLSNRSAHNNIHCTIVVNLAHKLPTFHISKYSQRNLLFFGAIMRFLTFPVNFLVVVAYGPSCIDAFSAGAGGCMAGEAAVGGSHLANFPSLTGSLVDSGFSVVVDETTFPSSVSLEIGEEHTIYVRGSQFRGVLIMSDASPDDVSLTPFDDLLQESAACDTLGYPGITHTTPDFKTEVEGVLVCITEGTYNIGVTVVVSNNAQEGSTYYYTGFPLVCGGGGGGGTTGTVAPGALSVAPAEAEIPVIGGSETTTPPGLDTDSPPGSETMTPPPSSATSTTATLLLSFGAATAAVVVAWAI
jgi:hypothetical protein